MASSSQDLKQAISVKPVGQVAPHTLAHSTFKGTLYAKYLPATNATQLFDHPRRDINDFFAVITGRLPEGDTYRDGGFRHYAVTYAEAAQAHRVAA